MIGLLGGTFNPVHIGHLHEARVARKNLGLSRIIFMPANIPPHKALPEGTPSGDDRLEMLKIALSSLDFAEVSDLELRRGGPSYTADTVEELLGLYPDERIALICGSDMFVSLDTWRRCEYLFATCLVVAFPRGIEDDASMKTKAAEFKERYGADIKVFDEEIIDISSTDLRGMLKRGEGNKLLPEGVYSYIKEKGLYGIK